jgi:hypothetical protein
LLLPAAMFHAGNALLFPRGRVGIPTVYGLAACVLAQLLVTSVAIYSASFSKSTMRAILVAVAILVASFGGLLQTAWSLTGMLVHNEREFHRLPAALHLVPPLMLLLMLCLTQGFAWTNFRRFGTPVRRLVIQLLVLLIAVGLASVPLVALVYPVWQAVHSTP